MNTNRIISISWWVGITLIMLSWLKITPNLLGWIGIIISCLATLIPIVLKKNNKTENEENSIEPVFEMSGPEFLKMLEEQNKNNPPDPNITNLTITLTDNILPMERAESYEDPLDDALGELADVSGGGTYMQSKEIINCNIEINLKKENLSEVLKIVTETLVKCNAPKGSFITQYFPEKIEHQLYEQQSL